MNCPLQVYSCPLLNRDQPGSEKTRISYLAFSSSAWILTALKKSEDNPYHWIVRGYESQGKTERIDVKNNLGLDYGNRVNLLEEEDGNTPLEIQPWEILTLKLRQEQT